MPRFPKLLFCLILLGMAFLHDYFREGFAFPAALVIACSFLFCLFRRVSPWILGLLLGLVIPASKILFLALQTRSLPINQIAPSLVAIIPATAAAWLGCWVREYREKTPSPTLEDGNLAPLSNSQIASNDEASQIGC